MTRRTASATSPVTPAGEDAPTVADDSKEIKDEDVEMPDANAPKDEKGSEKADDDKQTVEKSKGKETGTDKPVEVIDVDELDSKATVAPTPVVQLPPPVPIAGPFSAFNIDVSFEASKLPLDVAIFNSARAAGGDEKIRKYLQAVLIIGGTALVPGMAHALESRHVYVVRFSFRHIDNDQI